jgi:CheY-like chemotaxis protein
MTHDLFRVLLVDDDELDAKFLMRAFGEFSERVSVSHVESAVEAMAALAEDSFNIVLLDINLNGANGLDLIVQIRQTARTRLLPVVMFTSSNSKTDIECAYGNGANAYAEKPLSIQGYRQFAMKFLDFWSDIALVP